MTASTLRRWSYVASAALALGYVGYVLVMKFIVRSSMGGPLGEVGEFLLVLASVALFSVGLFADEALRRVPAPASPSAPDQLPSPP